MDIYCFGAPIDSGGICFCLDLSIARERLLLIYGVEKFENWAIISEDPLRLAAV